MAKKHKKTCGKNVGNADRIARLAFGALLIWWGVTNTGNYASLAMLFGILFFITGVTAWCGLYHALGIKTCKHCDHMMCK